MRAKQGGSFAAFLLLIPLSAIPLMAIFGVPSLTHLSASSEEAIPDIVRQTDAAASSGEPDPSQGFRSRAADLLTAETPAETGARRPDAPQWSAEATAPATSVEDRQPAESALEQQRRPSPRPMETAAIESAASSPDAGATAPAAAPTAAGLTWREATRRLDEVGIKDFRLERGESADRFLFYCRFSPGGDARIIQRFEAEAAEPLDAVEDVLSQIEAWLKHRYAQNRMWVQ